MRKRTHRRRGLSRRVRDFLQASRALYGLTAFDRAAILGATEPHEAQLVERTKELGREEIARRQRG